MRTLVALCEISETRIKSTTRGIIRGGARYSRREGQQGSTGLIPRGRSFRHCDETFRLVSQSFPEIPRRKWLHGGEQSALIIMRSFVRVRLVFIVGSIGATGRNASPYQNSCVIVAMQTSRASTESYMDHYQIHHVYTCFYLWKATRLTLSLSGLVNP